jgi:hypothetical protein
MTGLDKAGGVVPMAVLGPVAIICDCPLSGTGVGTPTRTSFPIQQLRQWRGLPQAAGPVNRN